MTMVDSWQRECYPNNVGTQRIELPSTHRYKQPQPLQISRTQTKIQYLLWNIGIALVTAGSARQAAWAVLYFDCASNVIRQLHE
jgi:hypothetical protein